MSTDKPAPTLEELKERVVPSAEVSNPVSDLSDGKERRAKRPVIDAKAELVLRHAALNGNKAASMEEGLWKPAGITSGSQKRKILDALTGAGFIFLRSEGRSKRVVLYPAAWEYLGMKPPTGEGRGGDEHKRIVARIAKLFRSCGYESHVEHEVGPDKKRVDVLCTGPARVAVELDLSSVGQAVKNITGCVDSGAIDLVLSVGADSGFLSKVRDAIEADAYLQTHRGRIHFFLMPEESNE